MKREGAIETEYNTSDLSKFSRFSSNPSPLMREISPPETFPMDALGSLLSGAASAIHDQIQAPEAMCAQSVLAAATLAVQSHVNVELPTGQIRPVSCLFLTVAESGERKSSVDDLALLPAHRHEATLREKYSEEKFAWQNEQESWEKQRAQILGSKKEYRGQSEKRRALDDLGPAPNAPRTPIVICSEPTLEGLVKMLETGQPSVGIFSAEGGQFIGGHGMTAENKLRTAAGLSSLWDGTPIKRVRAGDGTSTLPGRRVSMHLMAQPGVMSLILSDPMLTDQGLLSRVLIVGPQAASGTRFWREKKPELEIALNKYHTVLKKIHEVPAPIADGTTNELAPRTLALSQEARRKWIAFSDHIEGLIGPGGPMWPIKGLANKLAEHSARLAAVLTLAEDLDAAEVGGSCMEAGIDLSQHYAVEALRHFATRTINESLLLAETTRMWLLNVWEKPEVSLPDLYQYGPNQIRDKNTALNVARILEDHGWLLPVEGGSSINGKTRREVWKIVRGES
jgi:hypothetical protein